MSSGIYLVPAEEIRRTLIIVNSRFIASLAPVFTVEEARDFIASVRVEYQDAMRQVVSEMPRAEKRRVHLLLLEAPYTLFERLQRLTSQQHGIILQEDFGEQVTLTLQLGVDYLNSFQAAISELSNGKLRAEVIETRQILTPV